MRRRSGNAALASTFHRRSMGRRVSGVLGSVGPVRPPVAGFTAWWDASQITGVADGANLTTWPDSSGNSHTITSSATAPVYWKTTGAHLVNGLPTVQFATGALNCSLTIAQPWSFMAVFKASTTSGIHGLMGSNGTNVLVWIQPGGYQLVSSQIVQTGVTQDTSLHTMYAVANGASSKAQLDGTAVTGNAGTLGISGTTTIGAVDNAADDPWVGLICEVLIWPLALSAANITAMRSYCTTKWGTP